MAQTDIPDAMAKIDSRAKDVPWYIPEVDKDVPARTLLEEYSKIPPEDVERHINTIVLHPVYTRIIHSGR